MLRSFATKRRVRLGSSYAAVSWKSQSRASWKRLAPSIKLRMVLISSPDSSSHSQFVQTVQGGHLVSLGQGGIVEDSIAEILDRSPKGEHRLANVNDLGCRCPMAWTPKSFSVLGWNSSFSIPVSSP